MKRDPVTSELRNAVFERDGFRCLAPILAAQHDQPIDDCKGQYGQRAFLGAFDGTPLYDLSALTYEHVTEYAAMGGKRAPARIERALTLCWHHNTQGWAQSHKRWEREYLRELYAEAVA